MVDIREIVRNLRENDTRYYNTYLDEMVLKLPEGTLEKLRAIDNERLTLIGRLDGIVFHFESAEAAHEGSARVSQPGEAIPDLE